MKTKILILVLSILFAIPCVLCAEEVEIQLMEVVQIGFIEGDSPLDGPEQSPDVPTRPRNFRATIDGTTLTVNKQEEAIPFAQAVIIIPILYFLIYLPIYRVLKCMEAGIPMLL